MITKSLVINVVVYFVSNNTRTREDNGVCLE